MPQEYLIRMPFQLKSGMIPLNQDALTARINAIAQYESQLSTFFEGHDDLVNQVTSFIQKVGGERIWHRIP